MQSLTSPTLFRTYFCTVQYCCTARFGCIHAHPEHQGTSWCLMSSTEASHCISTNHATIMQPNKWGSKDAAAADAGRCTSHAFLEQNKRVTVPIPYRYTRSITFTYCIVREQSESQVTSTVGITSLIYDNGYNNVITS
jgi:hypothetical protein